MADLMSRARAHYPSARALYAAMEGQPHAPSLATVRKWWMGRANPTGLRKALLTAVVPEERHPQVAALLAPVDGETAADVLFLAADRLQKVDWELASRLHELHRRILRAP